MTSFPHLPRIPCGQDWIASHDSQPQPQPTLQALLALLLSTICNSQRRVRPALQTWSIIKSDTVSHAHTTTSVQPRWTCPCPVRPSREEQTTLERHFASSTVNLMIWKHYPSGSVVVHKCRPNQPAYSITNGVDHHSPWLSLTFTHRRWVQPFFR